MLRDPSKVKAVLKIFFYMLVFSMALYSSEALAADPSNAGVFDDILKSYQEATTAWGAIMVSKASWLFWSLVLISMVWTYGMMALRKADLQEFFAETIRFFVTTGFFWWILTNGPAIALSIINTLRAIGGQATGTGNKLTPSDIGDIGFKIIYQVFQHASIWKLPYTLAGEIMGLIILIILTLISVNMLILLISGWILAYGGIFFLGFGGARWTSDIAINYYKTVLGLGAQLMAMILLIGIGSTFITKYSNSMSDGINLLQMSVLLVASIILFMLIEKVPPMLAGIVSGGAIGGGGGGGFGASAAMGAAGIAAAAIATGGAAAMADASQIAGGASALKAAFQSAQQSMASGSGGGGLSGAMGTAGKFAADMGSSLAKGMGDVVKDKASGVMDSMKENIGQTMGGKVASSIRKNTSGNSENNGDNSSQQTSAKDSSSSQSSFSGDSLGAGNSEKNKNQSSGAQNGSTNEEVVSFVNKGRK